MSQGGESSKRKFTLKGSASRALRPNCPRWWNVSTAPASAFAPPAARALSNHHRAARKPSVPPANWRGGRAIRVARGERSQRAATLKGDIGATIPFKAYVERQMCAPLELEKNSPSERDGL